MISRLLHKSTSVSRIAAFVVSNLIGLSIMAVGLQFYIDARSLLSNDDSFLNSDYIAINKTVDSSSLLGNDSTEFTEAEIADLESQPWVKKVGRFSRADFRVYASVGLDVPASPAKRRNMSTAMFFEAVPDEFLDVKQSDFQWQPDDDEVPVIISKDYLALYNFGFASAAGLPRLSEQLISGIPLTLTLSDESGTRRETMFGRIAGYSNRFNTILVPKTFLDEMNTRFGSAKSKAASRISPNSQSALPARLIVDVNSPGDAAIAPYLENKGWEIAGDKSASAATYLLRTIAGIIILIGSVITALSVFILILSISLIMEKNRRKLHSLLMLGYPLDAVARPYLRLTGASTIAAGLLSFLSLLGIRSLYIGKLTAIGAASSTGILWPTLLILAMTALIIFLNSRTIHTRIRTAWR